MRYVKEGTVVYRCVGCMRQVHDNIIVLEANAYQQIDTALCQPCIAHILSINGGKRGKRKES